MIYTKFLPATNFKPSRIKTNGAHGSMTIRWDYGLSVTENHAAAIRAYLDKNRCGRDGFVCPLEGTPLGGGYMYILNPRKLTDICGAQDGN